MADVLEYRLSVARSGTSEWVSPSSEYAFKANDGSSHAVIFGMVETIQPSKILISVGTVAYWPRS